MSASYYSCIAIVEGQIYILHNGLRISPAVQVKRVAMYTRTCVQKNVSRTQQHDGPKSRAASPFLYCATLPDSYAAGRATTDGTRMKRESTRAGDHVTGFCYVNNCSKYIYRGCAFLLQIIRGLASQPLPPRKSQPLPYFRRGEVGSRD